MSPYGDPRRLSRMTLADNGEGTEPIESEDGAVAGISHYLPLIFGNRSIRSGGKNGFV